MKFPSATILTIASLVLPNVVNGSGNFNFSYDLSSPEGPTHWGDVNTGGAANQCGGNLQSPIDIATMGCGTYADYKLIPGDCATSQILFTIEKNGIKGTYPTDGTCTRDSMVIPGFDDEVWEILQFHFHIISEHTYDERHSGAELHIVHQLKTQKNITQNAVIGVMFEPDSIKNDDVFETILTYTDEADAEIRKECGVETATARNAPTRKLRRLQSEPFDVYSLISSDSGFYQYQGSLTTPPCTEGILWNVADKSTYISPRQYSNLVDLVLNGIDHHSCAPDMNADPTTGDTARPVVPLNGRTVQHICPSEALRQTNEGSGNNGDGQTSGSAASLVAVAILYAMGTAYLLV